MENSTSRFRLLAATLAALTALGCQRTEETVAEPASRPVKTIVIAGPGAAGMREFPARIAAAQQVDLAFRLPGRIVRLPVAEGQLVDEGNVIASLDDAQYRLAVDDRSASYERARGDYERGRNLVADGNLSRMDFDRLDAQYRSARAALDQARDDLDQTVLQAPFAGRVARRFVENFTEVQAGQPVVSLTDVSVLEVKVDLPQEFVIQVREPPKKGSPSRVQVAFGQNRDRRYPLTFEEVATQADPVTQTFEVTFTLPAPQEMQLLPGMTATVFADLGHAGMERAVYLVPADAVVANENGKPEAWIVEPKTMTVAPRGVAVGNLRGDTIEVTSGLAPGDRIVVAGTAFLREGMKVTLLPQAEQPSG